MAGSKNMLLSFAFEVLEVHRVEFRCDSRNTRSATGIEWLGARFKGILRGHRAAPGGGRSDTAVFSLLSEEWPRVREDFLRRLAPFAVAEEYPLRAFAAL
ncbi:GNAT family N-acetyltransferase [Pseudarthrobacter sp. S9]|uniref:GNAT family N-acetyltransferase n=1 Tax=Pseudarthrobacter sp. S9 TaxID=3418421 RepID=UPI003D01A32C